MIKKEKSELKRVLKKMNNFSKVFFSVLIGLIVAAAILIIFASVLVKNDISPEYLKYFWIILSALCGIISGGVAGKITDSRGFIWGSITSAIISICMLVFLFFINAFSLNIFSLLIIPVLVFFGALGGIISSNLKK